MYSSRNLFLLYWNTRVIPQSKRLTYRPMPISFADAIPKAPLTTFLFLLIIGLEIFKIVSPLGSSLFEYSAFRVSKMSSQGVFLSGVFHEGVGHFIANLIGLLVCLGVFELALGTGIAALVFLLGAWLANPIAVGILHPLLEALAPSQVALLLRDYDYGASNGIYAVVGGLSVLLNRPGQLLWPFVFNGMLYALVTSSWLALQHEVSLLIGFSSVQSYLLVRAK